LLEPFFYNLTRHPKKQPFDNYNNQQIKQIQYKLNKIPREKLSFAACP